VLRSRIATAAVALPVVLAIILFAAPSAFVAFIALLTGWGLYEVGAMTQARGLAEIAALVIIGGGAAIATMIAPRAMWPLPLAVGMIMLAIVAMVAMSGAAAGLGPRALLIAGALYVGALYPFFAILRNSAGGTRLVIFVLLLVVASDSGAYFAGRALGRHKLIERVSPNKTVEGAVGGLILTVIAGMILRGSLASDWSTGATVLVSGAISILAQAGDLAGSAFKRLAGVKDSGWIFPGHGGLIDRTCSLVFAMALTYYLGT